MAILKTGKTVGVCVHHSAYKPANNIVELKAQAKLFDGWHKKKEWAEKIKTNGEFGYQYIEYHYLIALDGSLLQVQDEKYVLYHSGDNFRGDKSFNLHGVAVCLTGNYETDKPTDAQMLTLVKLIRDVEKRYKVNALVRGHKETSQTATACPGKNIGTSGSGWLKKVIENVNNSAYPPVTPPQPVGQTECEKEVERLKEENKGLAEALAAAKEDKKLLGERILFLEQTLEEREEELKTFDIIKEERDRFLKEKLELEEEISKLKNEKENSLVKKIADFLNKLLKR